MTIRIQLIVKGDKHTAALKAAEHGIPFAFVKETPAGPDHFGPVRMWTVGLTDECHETKVAKWHIEDTQTLIPGFGFPLGSLLVYSYVDEQGKAVDRA